MENFKKDFTKLIQKEIEDPSIKVLHFKIGEPVSDDTIQKVEDKFGFALDPVIKSFYKQCNGISYRAYKVNSEAEKSGAEKGKIQNNEFIDWGEFSDDTVTDWISNDAIKENSSVRHLYIRPLEDVLLGEQYLIEKDIEEQANLYLFDAWNAYNPVMLTANNDEKSFNVVIGDSYGADYMDDNPISFQEYLEGLLNNPLSERRFNEEKFSAFSF